MGYYEILALLEKQLDNIQTKHDYLKNKKEKAIQSKQIAEELYLNIRSVREVIRKMQKREEIEVVKGLIDSTERYYILSEKLLDKKQKWNQKQ